MAKTDLDLITEYSLIELAQTLRQRLHSGWQLHGAVIVEERTINVTSKITKYSHFITKEIT